MNSIFTVSNKDLERLSEREAVNIFAELLWAEANSIGIHKNLINVPSAITVADGGIDAEVQTVAISVGQGIIKEGLTRYQIKTGDFSLGSERNIKSILFKDGTNELKPKVKSCLDNNGTLIVVLFGWDNPETEDNQLINKFLSCLTSNDPKYSNATIEIFQQNKLISFVKSFPSLALRINGRDKFRFQTHHSWSQEDNMRHELKMGEKQTNFVEDVAMEIRNSKEAVHIRVIGEPGIGKTRLVLEATKADDLKPFMIYCDAKEFKSSELMNEILRDDNTFFTILVLDECDRDNQAYIWNKVKTRGSRVKLISIYNEKEDFSGTTKLFEIDLLENKQIIEILFEYIGVEDHARRWAKFCSGSPRVAHVIGWNLKNNPEDVLKPLDTVNIWKRYITAGDTGTIVEERRIVLQQIALFKRFGYSKPLKREKDTIVEMVKDVDPQITDKKFEKIVTDLRNRKILQGSDTLYITPKALHIKLWNEWWDNYGESFELETFLVNLPNKLQQWFSEMFVYARQSKIALKRVNEFLSFSGLYQRLEFLQSEVGANLFLSLTEADPKAALACLKRLLGSSNKEQLLAFSEGRREIIWALEKIVVWRELFFDAATLLLSLAEAENEKYSNNATGVFVGLFSPGHGSVSPTEASLRERFSLLEQTLESSSKERRLIGLQACEKALITEGFSRIAGAEYQGLRKEPELWMPKTYEEFFKAYEDVWQLLRKKLVTSEKDEQDKIVDILLNNTIGIGSIKILFDMVFETVNDLAKQSSKNKKKALKVVIELIYYYHVSDNEKIPDEILQKWEKLKLELTGDSFSSLLKRYVGMDLLEDRVDQHNNSVDHREEHVKNLAAQAIQDSSLLLPELHWLVTKDAQNGFNFGEELALKDKTYNLFSLILEAQRNASTEQASVLFLGGYFYVLAERDIDRYENKLDELVLDPSLSVWIAELSFRAIVSDRAALRILELAKKGIVKTGHFRMFCFGGVLKNISEGILRKWLEFLIKEAKDKYAIFIAMDMFHLYYLLGEQTHKFSDDLILKLLLHPMLFEQSEEHKRNSMAEHHWENLAKAFVRYYPAESLPLAEHIVRHLGQSGNILDTIHSKYKEILDRIAKLYPKEVWLLVSKYLDPKSDSANYRQNLRIQGWFKGNPFSQGYDEDLISFPLKEIFAWVDEDVEHRAAYIAEFVPTNLSFSQDQVCLARELLIKYGNRRDVRDGLISNFSSESWWGSASEHYKSKKQSASFIKGKK